MLMYLGKYAGQDATRLQHEPTVTLVSWANRVAEFLEEERRQMEEARK